MIGAGRLREVARHLRRTTSKDALGRTAATWSRGSTFRVEVQDSGAAEQVFAGGTAVVRRFVLVARWGTLRALGVTELDRLEAVGRTLRIDAIADEAGRGIRARIDCSEVSE